MPHEHTDRTYEEELRDLRGHLARMGDEVREMMRASLESMAWRDVALARGAIASDRVVNRLEVDTDEPCLRILARRQPVASDLRFIATALKLVTDLERIGDLCVNVCERVIELKAPVEPEMAARLVAMGERVQAMLETALGSFISADLAAAGRGLESDEAVDHAYVEAFRALLDALPRGPGAARDGTRLQSVAKYLERMGDHATNVAEMVIFMVQGKDVRHPGRLAT